MADAESTSPGDGAARAASRGVEPSAPPRRADDEVPPPARPPMSYAADRPPVLRKIPMPGAVRSARALWVLSFVLSGGAVLIAFLARDTLIADLTETLGRLAPGYEQTEVDSIVRLVYWASIVGLALVVAIEAVLLGSLLGRRGRARWWQLPVLALHTGVVLVASAFLAIGDWAVAIQLLILAGLALAVVAWVLCVVPSANRWFRMKDEAQVAALD